MLYMTVYTYIHIFTLRHFSLESLKSGRHHNRMENEAIVLHNQVTPKKVNTVTVMLPDRQSPIVPSGFAAV